MESNTSFKERKEKRTFTQPRSCEGKGGRQEGQMKRRGVRIEVEGVSEGRKERWIDKRRTKPQQNRRRGGRGRIPEGGERDTIPTTEGRGVEATN